MVMNESLEESEESSESAPLVALAGDGERRTLAITGVEVKRGEVL